MEPVDWNAAEDATLRALPATIANAEAGDIHAKRRLLEIFRVVVDSGRVPYPELLAYLSRHFGAALSGGDPAKSLGRSLLGAPASGGQPRSPENHARDQALVLAVAEAKKANPAAPELDIFAEVAELWDYTEDVVAHAWRNPKAAAILKGWPRR